MIVWIVGLSGAGKTTVAKLLYDRIREQNPVTVFLDGDILRDVWGARLGHTMQARNVNAHRISHLCRMLDAQNVHVVAAVLSAFPEWQQWNRREFSRYFEVFLDVPMSELRRRDSKNLYARAERGEITNVLGVDLEFPRPQHSDLVLSGDDVLLPPEQIMSRILMTLPPLEEAS